MKYSRGFTIVELLIVIVIIAILAAIGILGYNGIQGRASDTAVQSDLAGLSKKLETFKITSPNDQYATSFTVAGMDSPSIAKSSYGNNYVTSGGAEYNLLYCRNTDSPTHTKYAIYAGSRSGKIYLVTDGKSVIVASRTNLTTAGVLCPEGLNQTSGSTTYAATWYYSGGAWVY